MRQAGEAIEGGDVEKTARFLSGPLLNDGLLAVAVELIGKGGEASAEDLEELLTGADDESRGTRLMEINYTVCDCQHRMMLAAMSIPASILRCTEVKDQLRQMAAARKKSKGSGAMASTLVQILIDNAKNWANGGAGGVGVGVGPP